MDVLNMFGAAAMGASVKLAPVLGWLDDSLTKKSEHATASGSGYGDVGTMLQNGGQNIEYWASIVVVILGVIALLVAAYMLVTGLISHGKKQTSWVVVILLFVIGGVLMIGGWQVLVNVGGAANSTIQSWGGEGALILPFLG